jgi:hypothetical protein
MVDGTSDSRGSSVFNNVLTQLNALLIMCEV